MRRFRDHTFPGRARENGDFSTVMYGEMREFIKGLGYVGFLVHTAEGTWFLLWYPVLGERSEGVREG